MEAPGAAGAGLGDIDGDGVNDYAIGAPGYTVPGRSALGALRAYSGRTGALLYEVVGTEDEGAFGGSIAQAGDIDQDGIVDLLVGAAGMGVVPFGPFRVGTVSVLSGRTGAELRVLRGVTPAGLFGTALDGIGDVDGDGVPDVVVGEPLHSLNGSGSFEGAARVYSGATGALLDEILGDPVRSVLGAGVTGLGDWTGDGVPDYAVSNDYFIPSTGGFGEVNVHSGADGAIVHSFRGASPRKITSAIEAASDLDADGRRDLLMYERAVIGVGSVRSRVVVASGADQSELLVVEGPLDDRWGLQATLGGDADGDDVPDLLISAAPLGSTLDSVLAEAYSGRTGDLIVEFRSPLGGAGGSADVVESIGDISGDGRVNWMMRHSGFPIGGSCCAPGVIIAGLTGFDGAICEGEVNSTGGPALLTTTGTNAVAANDLGLRVQGLPPASRGVLLSSRTIGFIRPAFVNGRICIGGGPIGRATAPVAPTNGVIDISIDLGVVPLPGPGGYLQAVQPGDTVHWQYWYRDANFNSTVSNAIWVRFR